MCFTDYSPPKSTRLLRVCDIRGMLALTRRPARMGLRHRIDVVGRNGMPRFPSPVRDTGIIFFIKRRIPRFRPAVGFVAIVLITRFERLIVTIRERTEPHKRTTGRSAVTKMVRSDQQVLPRGRRRRRAATDRYPDRTTRHHEQQHRHTRNNRNGHHPHPQTVIPGRCW